MYSFARPTYFRKAYFSPVLKVPHLREKPSKSVQVQKYETNAQMYETDFSSTKRTHNNEKVYATGADHTQADPSIYYVQGRILLSGASVACMLSNAEPLLNFAFDMYIVRELSVRG